MNKKDLKLTRQNILPGYESGRYERAREYDSTEFGKPQLEDPVRRDNRISIRVSGMDLTELHSLALAEGMPVQSLLATIVHQYVSGELVKSEKAAVPATDTIEAALNRFRTHASAADKQD